MRRRVPSRRPGAVLAVAGFLAPLALPASAPGDDHRWINVSGGLFQDPADWSPAAVPIGGDGTIFDLSDTGYTVTFGNNVQDVGLIVRNDRVTFDIPQSLDTDFSIYDTRFKVEHGDEARGGGGIGGIMTVLARHAKERRDQAKAEGKPFDILLVGHFHQLLFAVNQGFIVNGSGKGYDEYARGKRFRPEPPQQALCVVTPEHGVSNYVPLFVGHRKSEGW